MAQQLLTVFGATGNQGGSLIAHVLQHPVLSKKYKLRGITRDVNKPAAVALKEKSVEVVRVSAGIVPLRSELSIPPKVLHKVLNSIPGRHRRSRFIERCSCWISHRVRRDEL